jgi:hypothetical protein
LTRLPPDNPIVTSYSEPTLKVAVFAVITAFIIGVTLQMRWLRATPRSPDK